MTFFFKKKKNFCRLLRIWCALFVWSAYRMRLVSNVGLYHPCLLNSCMFGFRDARLFTLPPNMDMRKFMNYWQKPMVIIPPSNQLPNLLYNVNTNVVFENLKCHKWV